MLDLTGNQLSELPDALAECKKLRILLLRRTTSPNCPRCWGLPCAHHGGLQGQPHRDRPGHLLPARLRWLILTDNAIERLPDELGQCDALQKLMLSGNRLAGLPETLAGCHRLELLRIAANRLEALPEWLLSLPRLSWLAFAGNPFCDEQACLNGTSVFTTGDPWQALSLGDVPGRSIRRHLSRRVGEGLKAPGGGGQALQGAVTSDGLPPSEMGASWPPVAIQTWSG